jgi:subtilisin family serine protease
MRRSVLAVMVALATLLTLSSGAVLAGPPGGSTQVIVVLANAAGDPGAAAASLGRAHGFTPNLVYRHALRGFAATVPAGRLAALRADPRVAYVEVDQEVRTTTQTIPTGVQRIFAPGNANLTINGSDDLRVDVDVAVIDSGIDLTHPDLNVNVAKSINCSGGSPMKASCVSGGNDDNGHGTHVAGSIGALDNGLGVVGVAPGARLWAVKVLNSQGSGQMSWIVAGIDYVTANAAEIEVANMSLGCECTSAALNTAISNSVNAGVVYVVAAGNSNKDTSTFSPANHPDVIAVSALADFNGAAGGGAAPTCRTDVDDTLASFSNWGSRVDITAPGVCILSTWMSGGYNTISGTSMASPHVAGAAALITSRSKPADKAAVLSVRSTIVSSGNFNWTDDSGDGIKERLLDVSSATVFNPRTVTGTAAGGTTPPPPADPAVTVHVADLDGSTTAKKTSWTARATILVKDSNGNAVAGASVTGTWRWSSSGSGAVTCTTGTAGTCTVSLSNIPTSTASVTYTVDAVSSSVGAYNPSANTDPDPDSNGTTITVRR